MRAAPASYVGYSSPWDEMGAQLLKLPLRVKQDCISCGATSQTRGEGTGVAVTGGDNGVGRLLFSCIEPCQSCYETLKINWEGQGASSMGYKESFISSSGRAKSSRPDAGLYNRVPGGSSVFKVKAPGLEGPGP